MIFWLTVDIFLIRNFEAFIVMENRHIRAAFLMIFLSFLNLRDMSHAAMTFNWVTVFLILRILLFKASIMCFIVRFMLN